MNGIAIFLYLKVRRASFSLQILDDQYLVFRELDFFLQIGYNNYVIAALSNSGRHGSASLSGNTKRVRETDENRLFIEAILYIDYLG